MDLDSLPARPLELSELRELDESGTFRTVLPAAVFDLDDANYKLVPVVVLVTEGEASAPDSRSGERSEPRGRIAGVGFDVDDGWTQVHGAEAADDEGELQQQARTANRALQDWAQKTQQPWAEPDGAGMLLDFFD